VKQGTAKLKRKQNSAVWCVCMLVWTRDCTTMLRVKLKHARRYCHSSYIHALHNEKPTPTKAEHPRLIQPPEQHAHATTRL